MASKHHLLPLLVLLLATLTCHLSSARHWVEEFDDLEIVRLVERDERSSQLGDGKMVEEKPELRKSALFGGEEGEYREINENAHFPNELLSIDLIVQHNNTVRAITFVYETLDHRRIKIGPWGRVDSGPGSLVRINLEYGERVTELFGTTGSYNGETVIRSIGFATSHGQQIGPYGSRWGEHFSFWTNGRIVAFYGRSQRYLNAIGAYYFID